ncbi:MAG TPA: 23S rRNA (pseudouridine(1915)-N(3))-methyltransferase RlmH [Geminicoccaceae bacterium]|nr:23S rRNA (pseudouridine(1915)-N(3))-methyltransferase RlmH [Geminicoccaceae bacterium]
MRLRIIAIGRCRDAAIRELTERYLGRCALPSELVELSPRGPEAEALLAALPAEGRIVALDERGRDLGSAEIAAILGRWRDQGERQATFVIGGADGLGEAVLARADLRLAFGRATWPHMLARAMLAEQLYRAGTILSGHPYHRA